jgi:hypothetical protein
MMSNGVREVRGARWSGTLALVSKERTGYDDPHEPRRRRIRFVLRHRCGRSVVRKTELLLSVAHRGASQTGMSLSPFDR